MNGLVLLLLLAVSCVRGGDVNFKAPSLVGHGESIAVSWTASPLEDIGKSGKDVVRLYCPPIQSSGGSTVQDYIDEWPLSQVMTADSTPPSNGTAVLGPLLNMRVACEVRFYRYVTALKIYIPITATGGVYPVFNFKVGPKQPLQAHVSLTNKSDEMRVTWVSADVAPAVASLWYSQVGNPNLVTRKQASSTTYTASQMCGGDAALVRPRLFRDPGMVYTALMTGLKPNTLYTYWYGTQNQSSSTTNVMSPQPVDGTATRARVIAFADMGVWGAPFYSTPSWNSASAAIVTAIQTARRSGANRLDAIAHPGDIAYALGKGYLWERFFYRIEPIARLVPYHVTIGNHEYDHVGLNSSNDPSGVSVSYNPSWGNYGDDSNGECGVPMARRFNMPQSSGSNGVFWYSHDVANIHMTYISTEHDLSPASVQGMWLRSDLKNADRTRQPWLIVLGHRPLYNNENRTNDKDLPVQMKLREFLVPLLAEFQVNLFIAGHYHNYVRTCPLTASGQCVDLDGTTHVTVGTGGADLSAKSFNVMPWVAKNLSGHGILSIQTSGKTSMILDFIDVNNTVLDKVVLRQSDSSASSSSRLSGGAIGGIAAGAVLVIAVAVVTIIIIKTKSCLCHHQPDGKPGHDGSRLIDEEEEASGEEK